MIIDLKIACQHKNLFITIKSAARVDSFLAIYFFFFSDYWQWKCVISENKNQLRIVCAVNLQVSEMKNKNLKVRTHTIVLVYCSTVIRKKL